MRKFIFLGLFTLLISTLTLFLEHKIVPWIINHNKLLSPLAKNYIRSSTYTDTSFALENNIKVLNVNLNSSNNPPGFKSNLSYLQEIFLTQDSNPSLSSFRSTRLETNKEIFLVLESLNESSQLANVYLQNLNSSIGTIEYKIQIKKGVGSLSLATNLPDGKYRLTIISSDKGHTIPFTVN